MYKLFGDLSDSDAEVEDRANVGGEVIGANANNHIGGDEDHQNHNRRRRLPSRATTKHKYKSDNRCLSCNRWDMRGNREVMNSEKEVHHQRIETNITRIVASEFRGSKYTCNVDEDRKDEELKPTRKIGPIEEEDQEVLRDVFGDSDENGLALYGDTKDVNRSPTKGEDHCANILQPKDVIRGKDMCYERESKRCPIGPPLNLVVPHIPPAGQPDRIKVMKVSNVVGINPKPFDPETYMEEDDFITDESEGKKMVHMNVVRWRMVKNADGTESRESNARFVQWKDGSMQLLIGDEALDVSVDESSHHTHLFMKNGKGLLQSQGRLLQKMRFMPPSPSSRSHRSLTTLVDSRNKKTIKVQTWYDTKDPERVKQERERDEEPDSRYNPHGRVADTCCEHDLEFEALAQRRIINAKGQEQRRGPRKGLVIDSDEEYPPKKQFLDRGKAVVIDSDDE